MSGKIKGGRIVDILVIGSNGQLGSDCMSELETVGSVQGVDFPEIDLGEEARVVELLDRVCPDVIVNCAAYTAVDACESDPMCWKVNADGPRYLATWAADHAVFLVHVSTDYVFDGNKPLFEAYTESDLPAPVSEYGKSKWAGEQAILESGAEAAILRTAWLYGANGKNFLKTMLRLALQDPEREIRVVDDQFGSPTWSHTLARQIAAVVSARATGLFHATSEGYCSWHELAEAFLTHIKVPFRMASCTSEEYPTPAQRPQNSILENRRLKEAGLNVFGDWRNEMEQFVAACGNAVLEEARSNTVPSA